MATTIWTREPLNVLAVTTEMREGELLGLKWSDIDFDGGILRVERTLNVIGGKLFFAEPKTELSRRRLVLPQHALQALEAHRERQREKREWLDEAWAEMDLVFPNTIGRPEDPRSFARREFLPLLRKSDLPRIRFHDLRHTAATLLLEEGINPKVVQEMLGHAHISITLGLYAHVTPKMLQAAARTMDDLFGM
jgi:integrase